MASSLTAAPTLASVANSRRLARTFQDWAVQDAARAPLWTPVALGAGAAIYFTLRNEPSQAIVLALLGASMLLALFLRHRSGVFSAAVGVVLCLAGVAIADWRTDNIAAPMLKRELPIRSVTGDLVVLEEGAGRRRLTIRVDAIEGLAPDETPARVRVTWRGKDFDAAPGERIMVRAGLSPPPEPVAPGAFDFARHLFFMRIGAVGYMVAPPARLTNPDETIASSFQQRTAARIERWRGGIARRIIEAAPGQGGAIVAALTTGKRAAINEDSENALRDSGLAHLLAISGLHMGLAAALIFFSLRAVLALIPAIALRYPIKKWAAVAALASCFIYLILSGGGWSARRAFIMTAVVFIAIIADRRAFSLRNVAIAATFILVTTPEAVLHPGFQMSFAAATALIAAFDWARERFPTGEHRGTLATLRRYAIGVAATDTVAALATAPFGLFHFHHAAVYSLAANMVATPLMGFIIMPFCILGLLTIPLGLDAVFWKTAAFGVDQVLTVGAHVAAWRGAVLGATQWPGLALAMIALGGLWTCLMSAAWRWAGFAFIAAGFAFGAAAPTPIGFISRNGDNGAVLIETAKNEIALAVFDRRKDRFSAGVWGELAGLQTNASAMRDHLPCDDYGCVANRDGKAIAFSKSPMGLSDDCAHADLVIAFYPAPQKAHRTCGADLIDRRDAWRNGAHAIFLENGTLKVSAASPLRGDRPWVARAWTNKRANKGTPKAENAP